jgi:hypothetical protein
VDRDQSLKDPIVDDSRESVQRFAADEPWGIAARAQIGPLGEEQPKQRLGECPPELDLARQTQWPNGG